MKGAFNVEQQKMGPKKIALLKKWAWYDELEKDIRKRFLPFFENEVYSLIKDNQILCLMMPKGIDLLYRIVEGNCKKPRKRIISEFNEVDNSNKNYVIIRFDITYTGETSIWTLEKINDEEYFIHLFMQDSHCRFFIKDAIMDFALGMVNANEK